ncbi:uncharacterized protein FOMMEDRAFT_170482 [Fomitiporia mediterranea MF3/22]|uniref:uncharacterized protein n=1 Tax=Fomitiporia mediterranea (strain MF3/22) TaxID=694068 RepID=UPI0004409A8D|nr:uncharacterized protein FOMMEDRAFT_170482 [Fomitiporia mediterranea MF3/22]EJC99100.1 hypothetical protein FOMMEDRAFT_170482 [Fomitiporia mediterranea MF3/22]
MSQLLPTRPISNMINTATSERPQRDSAIGGEEPMNTAGDTLARATGSSRDSQQAQGPPNEESMSTGLCASSEQWDARAMRHKLEFSPGIWENDEFDKFIASFQYPLCIKSDNMRRTIKRLLSGDPKAGEAIKIFKEWHEKIDRWGPRFIGRDKYGFADVVNSLVGYWRAFSFQADEEGNEASIRWAVDGLIIHAFQLRPGANQAWRSEMELVLPDVPDTVRADAITTYTLPERWNLFLSDCPNNFVFSGTWIPDSAYKTKMFVTSTHEAKLRATEVAKRRVQLTLYTSQLHRRALCLTDGPVFGTTLDHNVLTFYVANWEGDTVVVRPVLRPYNLRSFDRFIEVYFMLSRIADFQKLWIEAEMRRWDEDTRRQQSKFEASAKKHWRPGFDTTRKRKRSDGGGQGQRRQDTGDADHMEERGGIGSSSKHEIRVVEDRVKRGDPPPKDGYPLSDIHLYIFDRHPEFQPCCCMPSVSDWSRDTSSHSQYHKGVGLGSLGHNDIEDASTPGGEETISRREWDTMISDTTL